MSARQFSTFLVSNRLYGIDVMSVQEITKLISATKVPLAPSFVHGLINLRGQIVTAIDLRQRLNLKLREEEQVPMNVVVRMDDGAVSFLVDEIGDVVEVDPSTYEHSPETIDEKTKQLIRGVYKLKDRLLLVLDSEKAINLEAIRS